MGLYKETSGLNWKEVPREGKISCERWSPRSLRRLWFRWPIGTGCLARKPPLNSWVRCKREFDSWRKWYFKRLSIWKHRHEDIYAATHRFIKTETITRISLCSHQVHIRCTPSRYDMGILSSMGNWDMCLTKCGYNCICPLVIPTISFLCTNFIYQIRFYPKHIHPVLAFLSQWCALCPYCIHFIP